MKNLLFVLILALTYLAPSAITAQTYTTTSKQCGACHQDVSVNSQVGMKCPHCGVTWGQQSTTYNQSVNGSISYPSYTNNYYTSATTITACNIRSGPSTNASIVAKADALSTFEVLAIGTSWVKIKYNYYDANFNYLTGVGYIYKDLLMLN